MKLKTQRIFDRAEKLSKKGMVQEAQNLFEKIVKDEPQNYRAKTELTKLRNLKTQKLCLSNRIRILYSFPTVFYSLKFSILSKYRAYLHHE